jgi:hypothetical protein
MITSPMLKAQPPPSAIARVRRGGRPVQHPGLPRDLVERATQRLGTVALLYGLGYLLAILTAEYVYHVLGRVPFDGWNSGYTVALVFVAISLGLYALSRSRTILPDRMLTVGLAFEVIGAFGIILGTVADTEWPDPFRSVGIPWTCAWILFFPFLVPEPPGRSAVAAFLSALMGPVGLVFWHLVTNEPMPATQIFGWLTLPAMICAGIATVGAHIVYSLGSELGLQRELGAYRLEERVSYGGMGEIWRARHGMLARPAAIKLVRPERLGNPDEARAALARFEREALATARLTSPHTVRLYDYGVTEEGTFYYAMELLEGMDLDTLVQSHGPVLPERAAHFLVQTCQSLAEAHDGGLIHRDIKPANLFACRQGIEHDFLKVLDFGLVRPETGNGSTESQLTATGLAVGTPAFLAPETAMGQSLCPATDVYSLGCVGYWLITGRHVFDGESPIHVVMSHVRDAPLRPCLRTGCETIHDGLEDLLMACLEKDPKRRPRDAHAVLRELLRMQFASPWTLERAAAWWREVAAVTAGVTGEEEVGV